MTTQTKSAMDREALQELRRRSRKAKMQGRLPKEENSSPAHKGKAAPRRKSRQNSRGLWIAIIIFALMLLASALTDNGPVQKKKPSAVQNFSSLIR